MKRIIRTTGLSLGMVLLLLAAACGSSEESPTPTPMPIAPAEPTVIGLPTIVPTSQDMTRQYPTSTPVPAAPAIRPTAAGDRPMPAEGGAPVPIATSMPAPGVTAVPQSQPGATTFRDNERTTEVHTSRDSISTFSLDTDRTSFQLALNWARAGYEVDPDSVRSEEWVNAFDYQYGQPSRPDSFAIYTDVMPHPLDSGMVLARVGFQAPELHDDGRPLNVTLVIDSSGSMSQGSRVEIARAAADSIRRSLSHDDRISVVQFSTGVLDGLTVENRQPDSGFVSWSIDELRPRDSTNVQAGLNRGVEIADSMRRHNPEAHNYIVLMSDGVANVDATDPFAILESAGDRDSSNPLRLITIGVGIENYNDHLLEQLAQHGNGWYRYLDDSSEARALFSRESWLALSIPFADQTRAQVTWDPEVVDTWRIVGYENRITSDESFTEARKEFAEIPSGAATTVFYELRLKNHLNFGDAVSLGDVELRWVTPISNDSNRQHAQMLARYDQPSNDVSGALLQFGALVALAADRYSSLPWPDSPYNVQYDLSVLQNELLRVEQHIGSLASYQDFAYVLDSITVGMPAPVSSGYSR